MAANAKARFITATAEDIEDGTLGACLGCGEQAYGVEPDARAYECECCGERKVYGLEELLMMGRLELSDEGFED